MSWRSVTWRILEFFWTGADSLRKVLHLVVLLLVFSIVVGALSPGLPHIPSSGVLYIQPTGSLVDQKSGEPFARAVDEIMGNAEPETLVSDVVDALGYAKADDRITAVVLDLSAAPTGGFAKFRRIADALDDFRESGKPVLATADFYMQGAYFLAARADEIYMHPQGLVGITGFGAFQNFFKNAIDKLQIDWNVFRVGTYKSAVEPFTREDMSEQNREALGHVIDQLWQGYTSEIESARGLESGAIQDLVSSMPDYLRQAGGHAADMALNFGLVDGLATREEFRRHVMELAGTNDEETSYPVAYLDAYLEQMRFLAGRDAADENVAIVVAAGEILDGSQPPGQIGGDSTARLLREARLDDTVKAVVLRVDSPGGSSFASEIIRNEILELRAAGKPVVASMSSVAASGGYWIAMAADRIFATPYTITGSIGIFGMFPTFQRSLDAIGITTDGFGTTPIAGDFRADREMSEEARQLFQMSIDAGYDDFISRVAEHRGISKDEVDEIAQGRIWTGVDALERGLIDSLGEIDLAVESAAELANIENDYGTIYIEPTLDPAQELAMRLLGGAMSWGIGDSAIPPSSVERLATFIDRTLSPLARFNDPRGIYAHCFCGFR